MEVTKKGKDFTVEIKQNRLQLIKALFTGKIILELESAQAKLLSKQLYIPVKKVFKKTAGILNDK